MPSVEKYWFPAKTYGWGWGLPTTWQGWVVIAAFSIALVVLTVYVSPAQHPVWYFVGTSLLSAVLVTVCWFTGEPPRWRWG